MSSKERPLVSKIKNFVKIKSNNTTAVYKKKMPPFWPKVEACKSWKEYVTAASNIQCLKLPIVMAKPLIFKG